MMTPVPLTELNERMCRFRARMDADYPSWEMAALLGRVNQYYFTGTLQDGLLLVLREREPVFWVRRSFARARAESLFPDIRPMSSFREVAAAAPGTRAVVHIETEIVPVALLHRFRKHFVCREVASLDTQVARVRSVKSPYELDILTRTGAVHREILEDDLPALLREGISEAEFGCQLFTLMVRKGHQGIARFGMFGVEVAVGQIGFGENSIYPTNFDGPGGCLGLEPAAPVLGSRERTLRHGDLVFVDIGFGRQGYHTDKTMTYMFGRPLPDDVIAVHRRCVELERQLASSLRPGAIPSGIYADVMDRLDPEFRQNFMGYGERRAAFLGHGVGLQVDEPPVIAKGFDEPLAAGMVLALEPKKGVPGVGMVGTENTFLVTRDGGKSLTGSNPGLILV